MNELVKILTLRLTFEGLLELIVSGNATINVKPTNLRRLGTLAKVAGLNKLVDMIVKANQAHLSAHRGIITKAEAHEIVAQTAAEAVDVLTSPECIERLRGREVEVFQDWMTLEDGTQKPYFEIAPLKADRDLQTDLSIYE